MATRLLALAFWAVFLLGASVAKKPLETLTVKDSENPEAVVNTDATNLRMTIATSKDDLREGEKCEVKVETHNPSARIEIVYMPALTVAPVFVPDKKKKDLRVDEYGPPMVFGRMSAKDERLNYVVLMGGDSYSRTYCWTAPDSGQVSFRAVYLNRKNGKEIGVKTWTGEVRSESKHLRISAQ